MRNWHPGKKGGDQTDYEDCVVMTVEYLAAQPWSIGNFHDYWLTWIPSCQLPGMSARRHCFACGDVRYCAGLREHSLKVRTIADHDTLPLLEPRGVDVICK